MNRFVMGRALCYFFFYLFVRHDGGTMSNDPKGANQPKVLFLREVKGGVSRELGEVPLREGYKPSKPAHLHAPTPVPVPLSATSPPQGGFQKGQNPPKPAGVHAPAPVPTPPAPPTGGKGAGGKK